MKNLVFHFLDRIQLTTDGHGVYVNAVEKMFGGLVDYAMYRQCGSATLYQRIAKHEKHFHQLCRASKLNCAYAKSPLYTVYQCFLDENGEFEAFHNLSFHVLQF